MGSAVVATDNTSSSLQNTDGGGGGTARLPRKRRHGPVARPGDTGLELEEGVNDDDIDVLPRKYAMQRTGVQAATGTSWVPAITRVNG